MADLYETNDGRVFDSELDAQGHANKLAAGEAARQARAERAWKEEVAKTLSAMSAIESGDANVEAGNYDEAIREYSKGISACNSNDTHDCIQRLYPFYNQRGLAYQGKGDHESAISDFTSAIVNMRYSHMDEDHYFDNFKVAGRLVNRANSYKAIGENDKAILDCQKAIRIGDTEKVGMAREILASMGVSYTPPPSSDSNSNSDTATRNGFVSFIFGLICGGGAVLGAVWYLLLSNGGKYHGGLLSLLGLAIAFFVVAIVAGVAWSYKKNILFACLFLLCVPGWLSLAGMVPNSLKAIYIAGVEAEREADRKAMKDVTVAVGREAKLYVSEDTKSKVERVIKKGDSVKIYGVNHENGWTRVLHNNYYGYVRTEFLSLPAEAK